MAITGDVKENYAALQQSTGERFSHMADRMEDPTVLAGLDAAGRTANRELAAWLRGLTDDEEAIERMESEENRTAAEQRKSEAQKNPGKPTPPQKRNDGRTTT